MGALSQYIHTDADHITRWLLVFAILSLRYVLMAGGAYLLFYVYKRRAWLHRKIQQKFCITLSTNSALLSTDW